MVVRVSEGVFLEILESEAVSGVPIEVDVYDGDDLGTMIATLEGAVDVGWTDPFGDVGSGSLRLAVADPKATATIIRSGNLVKCKLGGVYRYAYWIENPKATVATIAGVAGKYWTLAGRGKEAYLDRAQVYPAGYPLTTSADRAFVNATFGEILETFIDEAQARGAIPDLTYDFDAVLDSQGQPWLQTVTMTIRARTSLLDVWKQLIALGMEGHLTTDLRLQAFVEYARHKEDEVIFREGRHLRGEVGKELQDAALRTRVLVEGADAKFIEVADPALESLDRIGRREGGAEFTSSSDPTTLQIVGEAALRILSSESEAISVPVFHGQSAGDFDPYVDYRNGDWIRLDVPGFYDLADYRLRSISIKQIPGDYEVDLDLNSVAVEELVTLHRMIDALGGGSTGASSGGATGAITGPGNGGARGDGKVGVEFGDAAGYLYDKVTVAGGLAKALGGSPGSRVLELTQAAPAAQPLDWHTDVDTTTIAPTNGQALVFDSASGLWKPGTVGGGGGGGSSFPRVVQVKFAGTAIGSLTLDSAPAAGHTVLLYCDGFNTGDPTVVASTNTTWTKIKSVSAGAKYSLWVGVVAGGAGGTAITITHPNGFMSAFAIEVADTLVGTLGTSASGLVNTGVVTPAAPAAGRLVAIFGGCDNTTVANTGTMALPTIGFNNGIVWGVVGYSLGDKVYAQFTPNAGTLMIAEIS